MVETLWEPGEGRLTLVCEDQTDGQMELLFHPGSDYRGLSTSPLVNCWQGIRVGLPEDGCRWETMRHGYCGVS